MYISILIAFLCCSSKRGLDFGLHRGHSGMMTAKYLAGLEMAGPMGPGRKRSSTAPIPSDENMFVYEPSDSTSYPNELSPYIDNRQWNGPSNMDILYKQGLKHSDNKETNAATGRLRRSVPKVETITH